MNIQCYFFMKIKDYHYKICSHHDIAEILLKVALNTNQSINERLLKWLINIFALIRYFRFLTLLSIFHLRCMWTIRTLSRPVKWIHLYVSNGKIRNCMSDRYYQDIDYYIIASCLDGCKILQFITWSSLSMVFFGLSVSSTNKSDRHNINNVVESGVKHHNPNPADYSQSCIQWSPLGKYQNNCIRQVIAYLR